MGDLGMKAGALNPIAPSPRIAREPMKKSRRVILTVAAMGISAHAQQGPDPCEPATFNRKVCQVAVRHGGYCSGGTWVPMTYQQAYPNYYDGYLAYLSGGGIVTAAPAETCRRPSKRFLVPRGVPYGGFGATGAWYHAGG